MKKRCAFFLSVCVSNPPPSPSPSPQTGNSIVNGAHDTAKLVELLEGFIKKVREGDREEGGGAFGPGPCPPPPASHPPFTPHPP